MTEFWCKKAYTTGRNRCRLQRRNAETLLGHVRMGLGKSKLSLSQNWQGMLRTRRASSTVSLAKGGGGKILRKKSGTHCQMGG